MATTSFGPNLGHGYTKLVVLRDGAMLSPVVFPSIIARATGRPAGALVKERRVTIAGQSYWTGDDARQLSANATTNLTQDRLDDPVFLPALLAGALDRAGLSGNARGVCVSCLPASWSKDASKARALGARLREGAPNVFDAIQIIGEPLAMAYAALLDNRGQIAGDVAIRDGRVAAIDLGHHTDDGAVVDRLRPVDSSYMTFPTGTARALIQVRNLFIAAFERNFTLDEVDHAVRDGAMRLNGKRVPLPQGWDRPIIEHGRAAAKQFVEVLGRGADLDAILIGGGGAVLEQKIAPFLDAFPSAIVVDMPQMAIALGCARMAAYIAAHAR